jgi:peptidoglycan-associated lipoprotein
VKRLLLGVGVATVMAVGACADETPPAKEPVVQPAPPAPAPPPPPADVDTEKNPTQLNISEDIRNACGITDAEAKFDFNSATIRKGDSPVLDKLLACFTTGKLAGRTMRLVGHADPRGDEEYNLVLGGRRSDNVKRYLVGAGLKDAQAQTTSRGETDAEGTDEASWSRDRRVDIVLAN